MLSGAFINQYFWSFLLCVGPAKHGMDLESLPFLLQSLLNFPPFKLKSALCLKKKKKGNQLFLNLR